MTVRVTEATVPDGVTGVGEKLQDAPTGRPAQLSETGAANPFCGATNTVAVPLFPAGIVNDPGDTAMEKLGAAWSIT